MSRKYQRGFSLATAIFLVVVLAALGTFMVTISGQQHMGAANAVLGARAYYAARSGVEWGISRALTAPANCAPAGTTLTDIDPQFDVTVTCVATTHMEDPPNTYYVFLITALAETHGLALNQPGYVSRRVRVTVTDAP